MKKIKKIIFLSIFLSILQNKALSQNSYFIETSGKKDYYYRNFLALASSAGYTTDFISFFQTPKKPKLEDYKTFFLQLGPRAIIHIKNNLVEKCVQLVKDFSDQGNKNIILLLSGADKPAYINRVMEILEQIGVPMDDPTTIRTFLQYLFQHDGRTGRLYGTTLINKTKSVQLQPFTLPENTTMRLLPQNTNEIPPKLQNILPLGLVVKHPKTGNKYLITKHSLCCFSEINENFFLTPIYRNDRQIFLKVIAQMLTEFNNKNKKISSLPDVVTTSYALAEKERAEKKLEKLFANNEKYKWMANKQLSCAWLEPNDYFFEKEKKSLKKGLDFIYDSEINLLWFEFNPEVFLSKNSTANIKKKKKFFKQVRTLGKALKKRFAKSKKPMPKIFIGTDITTNFRSAPVAIAAKDFFGKTYSKIPSPLDFKHFWKTELLDVFDEFIDEFKKDIPIDGIFLDFEMYHAQKQSADFNNFMDFSDLAWKLYAQRTQQHNILKYISIKRRVNYLIETNQLQNYFSQLEQEAQNIGKKIKNHIQKKLPGTLIGAYAVSLPGSWFYRGLLAGLSSKEEPIIFATFNTDAYSHAPWLRKNNINIIHGAPIMLSKFKTIENFSLISELKNFNYFVWYNRPSRMIYPKEQRKDIWWTSEASLLPSTIVAQEIQKKENSAQSI